MKGTRHTPLMQPDASGRNYPIEYPTSLGVSIVILTER